MPSEGVDVSVLIPVLNEAAHLEDAVQAMLAQELDGTAEFLFIDGGSTDESIEILARLARADHRIRVLENPQRRTPQALNIGLRAARGEFIARMDAHTIYPPRYLDLGVKRLRRGGVDWVSGPQLAVGASPGSSRVALALTTALGTGGARFRRDADEELEVDTGFTGVWRRSTLEAHGGWDEAWTNDQDVELAARIREAGGRIVCVPAMAASYIPRDSLLALAKQYRKYGTYRVKTSRRHPESLRRSQVLPPALTVTALAALVSPAKIRRLARAGLGAYAAAVSVSAARAAADGGGVDAASLPAVWATMHVSYGVGFLLGCVRYGPPIAALAAVAGVRRGPGTGPGADGNCAAGASSRMQLGVYTDYTYRRADGQVYAERAFVLFLARLADELDRVMIVGKVAREPGATRYALPDGTGFVELPYYRRLGLSVEALVAMARSLSAFWRLLGEVDGVWLLGPHPLALAFAGLAAIRRKKIALGVRQDFPTYVRARHPSRRWMHVVGDLLESVWRGLARFVPVIAVGPALAAAYRPQSTLEIAVSLVRSEDIASPEVPARRRYDHGELRILSVGRLEQEKNPLLLADVIARLRSHDHRWRLLVCGEGSLEQQLRDRLDALGVADHVDLLGYVAHDGGLLEIYRTSHALLHVSWTEGLPQILFEAFAARLPVVATAVGGVPAAVGDAALLIEPGDAGAAAAALIRVCAEPELRERLIEAGVQRVAGQTLDAEARRVAAFLREAWGRA